MAKFVGLWFSTGLKLVSVGKEKLLCPWRLVIPEACLELEAREKSTSLPAEEKNSNKK
jgi:hypothetical protein